jgi:hypothetical protein
MQKINLPQKTTNGTFVTRDFTDLNFVRSDALLFSIIHLIKLMLLREWADLLIGLQFV